MPARRTLLAALAAGLAGCAAGPTPTDPPDTPAGSPESSPTPSPVAFPDGPKAEPARPDPLTRESVREYVRTHEHRYAYNTLYQGPAWDVSVGAEVLAVTEAADGFRVRVESYGGASRGGGTASPTGTPVAADWGRREFVYVVTPEATRRGPVRG
ncbi:MAG: hypothetical protein A07HB70_01495 [uncultured archaeon A07HB70]|nr:MAG: hypothetical protein A07HB70_01495 [uncultured archaeon A07HB70]